MGEMAKIVRHGDGQSVELPEGFRFGGAEVRISREGDRVVLESVDDAPLDDGAVDAFTGLTIRELRASIAEGLEGEDEPWDVEEIKREVLAQLAVERADR